MAQENVDRSQPSAQQNHGAALLGLSALQSVAGQTSSADGVDSSVHTSQQSIPIIKDPNIDISAIHEWIGFAEKYGHRLMHHCILCNQWCSQKTGGLKAHLRSCHAEHAQAMTDAGARLKHHYRLKYKGKCRACGFQPASAQSLTRPGKCPAYFQACVMHHIRNPEAKLHVGRSGHEGGHADVRFPSTGTSKLLSSVNGAAELDNVKAGPQDGQPQAGARPGRGLGQQRLELAEDATRIRRQQVVSTVESNSTWILPAIWRCFRGFIQSQWNGKRRKPKTRSSSSSHSE